MNIGFLAAERASVVWKYYSVENGDLTGCLPVYSENWHEP